MRTASAKYGGCALPSQRPAQVASGEERHHCTPPPSHVVNSKTGESTLGAVTPVKNYYWRERPNFGDALSPLLLKRFAGLNSNWATVSHAELIVTGSILEHVPPLWDGSILGAGRLYEDFYLHLHTDTATVWAVRGPLSAAAVPGDCAIGDPGLLADEMVYVHTRDIPLGVIPHHTDTTLAQRPEWFSDKWETLVIDPAQDPLEVIRQIGRCQRVVASSLHGLITADAFGIPRRFELNPHATRYEGGLFKFRDYSRSISTPLEPGKIIEASRFAVEDRKHELFDAFKAYGDYMRRQRCDY
jgi:pyruvyltransferase